MIEQLHMWLPATGGGSAARAAQGRSIGCKGKGAGASMDAWAPRGTELKDPIGPCMPDRLAKGQGGFTTHKGLARGTCNPLANSLDILVNKFPFPSRIRNGKPYRRERSNQC